ncbi:class I SAM-dependent methyltransferase [Phenylobacterium sp.]|uniref:class I SAM-dependent methyltransferase n=1 Tax=Phenylobacterium sp. TaxID=1871053 RepID=UPI002FCBCE4A
MRQRLRRFIRRGLEVTGMIGPLHRRQERRLARESGDMFDDQRPMPPAELMAVVSGTAGQAWFSERGRSDAARFLELAAAHGLDTSGPIDVWDLGCGCGRIARWMAPDVIAAGGSFTGSDINGALVAWCAKSLPGRYFTNRLRPPAKLHAGSVDLVYAYSVVTHLREKGTRAWLAEVARVLRPGGLALLTFHDEDYASAWGPPEILPALEHQDYVVWNDAMEGSNYMSTWTTRRYFAEMATPHFEVLDLMPGSLEVAVQAVAVLRRPG